MDAAIRYERFLHMEIDKLSCFRRECDYCDGYFNHSQMIDYDGKKFCCENCLEQYADSREEE